METFIRYISQKMMGSNQAEQLQNDIRLIQEVERHSNLYDPRCKDKDSKSKENAWAVIGIKLNLPAHSCKNRWKNLRDKYTREKKLMMIEGEEVYRSHSWPLLDEMSFLWNFVSHRNGPEELKVKKCSTDSATYMKYNIQKDWESMPALKNYLEDQFTMESSFLHPTCVLVEKEDSLEANDCLDSGQPHSKLRKLLENKDGDASYSRFGNRREMNYNQENLHCAKDPYHLMDEEEYFCLSLAASLRRLSKKDCSLLKIKILQILHEAQFGKS